ncbi:lipid II flippase MurJ [Candidatus Amarobacter glycogenicus]|uniref:lipid II flippase MurJ n=1 Tax=Candidatus Amarobacter glycogenicus TaxID=3140699 RepID=UPI002A0BCE14|nr:oligosaccharide flippase family protein [Dehalococcoidia bacterium]
MPSWRPVRPRSPGAPNYGWLLRLLPQGIFAQAVATVVFPTFATQVAQHNLAALRSTFTTALRTILFFTLPAAIGLILLARPLITVVLLQRNAFSTASTALGGDRPATVCAWVGWDIRWLGGGVRLLRAATPPPRS